MVRQITGVSGHLLILASVAFVSLPAAAGGDTMVSLVTETPIAVELASSARANPAGTLDLRAKAERVYAHAQQLESTQPLSKLLPLYIAAADAGYGPAQKRLANIYGGEGDVSRDYPKAITWQKRARQSGENIDLPHSYQDVAAFR